MGWLHDAVILDWHLPNFRQSNDLVLEVVATPDAGLPEIEGRHLRITFCDIYSIKLSMVGGYAGFHAEWIDGIDQFAPVTRDQPVKPPVSGWKILCTRGSVCEVVCRDVTVDIIEVSHERQ
ncbi:hypothetical protein AYO47_00265 [Planctomyces sp. SCGC AG-212-M04]|nr:hypothetical protein AYO47_00265 [Planctomyces sp. SCGC AG-212-M04]